MFLSSFDKCLTGYHLKLKQITTTHQKVIHGSDDFIFLKYF